LLNSGLQSVGPISVDASISGLNAVFSTLSGSVDTSSVGEKTVTFTAVDNADNLAGKDCKYQVTYFFYGFFQPIDMGTLNSAKAGQTIPVKYRLTDANGDPISDPDHFKSLTSTSRGTCSGAADAVETYSGNSGLQYLGDGFWQYNWKTSKSLAGQCRTMSLNLNDSVTDRTANFTFK
jgi:hypothetical protein